MDFFFLYTIKIFYFIIEDKIVRIYNWSTRLATLPYGLDSNVTQLLANLLTKPSVFYYLPIVPYNLVSIKLLLLLLLLLDYNFFPTDTVCAEVDTSDWILWDIGDVSWAPADSFCHRYSVGWRVSKGIYWIRLFLPRQFLSQCRRQGHAHAQVCSNMRPGCTYSKQFASFYSFVNLATSL